MSVMMSALFGGLPVDKQFLTLTRPGFLKHADIGQVQRIRPFFKRREDTTLQTLLTQLQVSSAHG